MAELEESVSLYDPLQVKQRLATKVNYAKSLGALHVIWSAHQKTSLPFLIRSANGAELP